MTTPDHVSTHDAAQDDRNDDIRIYVNGEIVHRDEARVSVYDSGFMLGDGVWEGLRLYDGHIPFLGEHLDRLYEAARFIDLDIGLSRDDLIGADLSVILVEVEFARDIQQVGAGQDPLSNDFKQFGHAGAHGGRGQVARDLRRFDQQFRLRLVAGRQRIGDGHAKGGHGKRDHKEIVQPPKEQRKEKFKIKHHYAVSSFFSGAGAPKKAPSSRTCSTVSNVTVFWFFAKA